MRLPARPRSNVFDMQMTAMIDVVFLLLIFFLWTSSFEEPEFDLASALSLPPVGNDSALAESASVPFDEIVIRVIQNETGAPQIRFNESIVDSLSHLQQRLTSIAAIGVQPAVIVHPDTTVPMETAIAVYDAARAAGFDRVLFTVTP